MTEEARLSWVRGTPLGRLVVPDVCRKSATSDGSLAGGPGFELIPMLAGSVAWGMPSLVAAAWAEILLVMSSFDCESER